MCSLVVPRASPSSPSASLPLILTLHFCPVFWDNSGFAWCFRTSENNRNTSPASQWMESFRWFGLWRAGGGFSSHLMPWVGPSGRVMRVGLAWMWALLHLLFLCKAIPCVHKCCSQPLGLPVSALELVPDTDSWLGATDWCPGCPPGWTVVLTLGKICYFDYWWGGFPFCLPPKRMVPTLTAHFVQVA